MEGRGGNGGVKGGNGVFLLEVGRWISMGSNECESLRLFVLSCGVFLLEVGGWTENSGVTGHHHCPSASSLWNSMGSN